MSAGVSGLEVQVTLTIGELRILVGLINLASEHLNEADPSKEQADELVKDVSGLYFQLMESIREDGYLADFAPEP